jgi:hypothetical protein
LKSSIIKSIEATHKNCKTKESYLVFFVIIINNKAINISITDENIELNHTIELKNINHDSKYIAFSEYFFFLYQIYKSIFQKIALQIYHHIRTIDLIHHEVTAYQLPSLFISIDLILHQVINAKKL